MNADMT